MSYPSTVICLLVYASSFASRVYTPTMVVLELSRKHCRGMDMDLMVYLYFSCLLFYRKLLGRFMNGSISIALSFGL